MKEGYVIYMSFHKIAFYWKDEHDMIWCDHALYVNLFTQLQKTIRSTIGDKRYML